MPLSGALARLDRSRDELAKAWLVRAIARASLEEIKELPTARIATQLPELISDLLRSAGGEGDPFDMSPASHERAARLAELRESREPSAAELARDVTTLQAVILEGLGEDAEAIGSTEMAHLAGRLAESVGALQAAAAETLVKRRSRELESLVNSDPLTGLSNLRHLNEQLSTQLELTRRYETPFALLVLDVDGLKRVNDAQGHQAGDRLLVQVAVAIRRAVRSVDTPARIGGDEFCVVAPNQTASSARVLADRLAESITRETGGAGGEIGTGVSIGVVSCPEHGTDAETLLGVADQAMYRAKAGGDRVAVGDPNEPELRDPGVIR
jgi:diguanylate cyclase (GGDEF)-like protein